MEGRKQEQQSRSNSPCHIFVAQNPASFPRGGSKIVSSQARRFQSAGKRRRQEAAAHQNAGYARSLVGWANNTNSLTPSLSSPASSRAGSQERRPSPGSDFAKQATPSSGVSVSQRANLPITFQGSDDDAVRLMMDYRMSRCVARMGSTADKSWRYSRLDPTPFGVF